MRQLNRDGLAGVRRAVLVAGLLVGWPAGAGAEGWSRVVTSGVGPSERSSPAVAGLDSFLYVFGGVRDDFASGVDTFFQDLYRLDVASGHWEVVGSAGELPPARGFAAAVAHRARGLLLVFGGAHYGPGFSDFVAYDDLWAFDVEAETWRQLVGRNAGPDGRSSPVLWIDGDRLYLFGGVTAQLETRNDLWLYDLRRNRWTELSPQGAAGAPISRHEAMGGGRPTGGRLLLYGGEHVDPALGFQTLNDVWEYDLGCGRWEQVTIAPEQDIAPARVNAASGVLDGDLFLQGGDLPGGDAGCGAPFPQNPTEQLWRFHRKERRWEQITPSGDPLVRLKRHEAARVQGHLYLVGGWDFQCPGGVGPGQIWNLEVFRLSSAP